MNSDNIIEIKNINKSFKDVHAVRDLSFCVRKGELFAFLGVNGAGKSTTISIICNQLKKDGGTVYKRMRPRRRRRRGKERSRRCIPKLRSRRYALRQR